MREILDHLLEMNFTITTTILCILGLRLLFRKFSRSMFFGLWILLCIRILCPFSMEGIYRFLPERQETPAFQPLEIVSDRLPVHNKHEAEDAPVSGSMEKAESKVSWQEGEYVVVHTAQNGQNVQKEQATEPIDVAGIAVIVWCVGYVVFIVYMAFSLFLTHRKLRDAKCVAEGVYLHPLVENSFVFGFLKPGIYISERLEEEDLPYILLHERGHIRRKDHIVRIVMYLVYALYWFNPLIWLAYYFMLRDMEIACDEYVLKRLDGSGRKKYAMLLIDLVENKGKINKYVLPFSKGKVKERIRCIMNFKKPGKVAATVFCMVFVLAGCSLFSEPEKKETVEKIPSGKQGSAYTYAETVIPNVSFEELMEVDEGFSYSLSDIQVDHESNLVLFPTNALGIAVWTEEGGWQAKELLWREQYDKLFEGKTVYPREYYCASDGYLYLYVQEYSMDPRKFEAEHNTENLSEEEIAQLDKLFEDQFFPIRNHILKIDEKAGVIEELKVPEIKGEKEGEVQWIEFSVFPDGNLCISDWEGNSSIYSGVTGEQLVDMEKPPAGFYSGVHVGDGFYCYSAVDQVSGKLEIYVYEEDTGELSYTLDTGLTIDIQDEKSAFSAVVGVEGNTILLATNKGEVFEAEYGEDSFEQIISPQKDRLYHLSDGSYSFMDREIRKGAKGSYYVYCRGNEEEFGMGMICRLSVQE